MVETWFLTVFSEMWMSRAICALVLPWASKARTSASRLVSLESFSSRARFQDEPNAAEHDVGVFGDQRSQRNRHWRKPHLSSSPSRGHNESTLGNEVPEPTESEDLPGGSPPYLLRHRYSGRKSGASWKPCA